ncbi:molybdopterin molybdotransferase [Catenuloplanes nepalensis]|uniref:Molybdopterin molybdenumtransferase n=1 Tax=Catenuloplanes nepalensis TaxID=587533 RepID=A0ABT9MK80_9ACTN|nr:molybdopterin molybdotransferase MoeA [Catenuloplanes nepalensis]MDP9791731.1 molybdopterin molybdotransferase [Catenuloplanes nepalensis]
MGSEVIAVPTSPGTDAHASPHAAVPRVEAGMSWHRAHRLAGTLPHPLAAERVPLARAHGHTLAEPATSAALLPGTDTAAMDGYAISGRAPWRVVGRTLAGQPAHVPLAPGTAVEIATGAPVPPGADAVLPVERCHVDGDTVTPSETGPGRTHIRYAGEDLTPGRLLAPAGTRVTATLAGLAAHAGLDELTVHRSPRVRLAATGDEIIGSGVPAAGQVRDALTPLLTALLTGTGGTLAGAVHVPDRADLLAAELASADWDVTAVTGSSSVGRADHLHSVLTRAGARWHVDGVACRPGHPQALAELPGGRWVVGLPGNPYAALVGAVTLLRPLLDALQGRAPREPLRLPVTGKAEPYDGGTRLVPVHLADGRATVVPGSRPASLLSAATADALAVIPSGWAQGDAADLLPVQ